MLDMDYDPETTPQDPQQEPPAFPDDAPPGYTGGWVDGNGNPVEVIETGPAEGTTERERLNIIEHALAEMGRALRPLAKDNDAYAAVVRALQPLIDKDGDENA